MDWTFYNNDCRVDNKISLFQKKQSLFSLELCISIQITKDKMHCFAQF